jgi:selenocysteine-specific elongation factor
MPRLILGTAGHIDHGKTTLVKSLTGVDTDRLKEEKERGITIDLGFAELAAGDLRLGVVDVPGHEGFVRNMLAGATGMDVVLLVVAADEGVMPQTREHLAIVSLLGVERLVVALTKCDLVEEEWLELAREEVRELLAGSPYSGAPIVATSGRTEAGKEELLATIREAAAEVSLEEDADLPRLPVDRVFTVRGTGTVVTGTLWSGSLQVGDRVRILPGEVEARVRGLQVHGRDVEQARAGERTAVALTGGGLERDRLFRGQVLVGGEGWEATHMVTARLRVLPDSEWTLERGQRVRVHLGSAEVMARLVLLDEDTLLPGEEGWGQLRLEEPALVRAREHFVLRSYSPMTTVGGGVVAEPRPPKRSRLSSTVRGWLASVLDGDEAHAVAARAELAGWAGEPLGALPVTTGLSAARVRAVREHLPPLAGPGEAGSAPRVLAETLFAPAVLAEGFALIGEAVDRQHAAHPLLAGITIEALRTSLPPVAHPALADALIGALVAGGHLVVREGVVARPGFEPVPDAAQKTLLGRLEGIYRDAGLAPPSLEELPPELGRHPDLWPLLRMLEGRGRLTRLEPELFIWSDALGSAGDEVRRCLAGRSGLGPADFREALPVTRKHLLPILAHLDLSGITIKRGALRDVPGEPV